MNALSGHLVLLGDLRDGPRRSPFTASYLCTTTPSSTSTVPDLLSRARKARRAGWASASNGGTVKGQVELCKTSTGPDP
jgi:hypothetical protein